MSSRLSNARTDSLGSLERAQRGDPAGFEQLVLEHQAMVFSLAYHFAGNAAAAEDVAQDVFFELFRSLAQIGSSGHLTSWLRRVTVHRCIDRFRRAVRYEEHGGPLPDRAAAPADSRDLLLEARVTQLITTLPAKARAVMVLRYQEDLDPSDIAALLEMPLNTVKSHLRRSLDLIRAKLGAKELV